MKNRTAWSLAFLGMVWMASGCGEAGPLDSYPEWVANEAVYCSDACVEARRDAECEWDIPENDIESCLAANCTSESGGCGGEGSLWEPSCYVDCVREESQAVQDAVSQNIACAVPSACR